MLFDQYFRIGQSDSCAGTTVVALVKADKEIVGIHIFQSWTLVGNGMRTLVLSSDKRVEMLIVLSSGVYFNALINRLVRIVVHFSLSKHKV